MKKYSTVIIALANYCIKEITFIHSDIHSGMT